MYNDALLSFAHARGFVTGAAVGFLVGAAFSYIFKVSLRKEKEE